MATKPEKDSAQKRNPKPENPMPPVKPPASPASLVPVGERGVMLRSMEDLLRFARLAVAGGAAPKGMSEGAAALCIQAGLERGLGPLGGLQQCVVINGVLSWRGQAAFSLIINSGLCRPGTLKFWTEGSGEDRKGVASGWRQGYAKPSVREFSVKDAKQAGLWQKPGPWKDYPTRMLAWRALGFLARDVFPDVLGGFPLAEEAMTFVDGFARIEPSRAKGTEPNPRAELPAPRAHDPILSTLFSAASKDQRQEIVKENAEAEEAKAKETEDEDPPFASHQDADRWIAKQDEKKSKRG